MSKNPPRISPHIEPLNCSIEAVIKSFNREHLSHCSESASCFEFSEDQALGDALVKTFLLNEVCKVFGVKPQRLLNDSGENYRLARRACYHLLVRYTHISKSEIGRQFKRSRQQVHYHLTQCEQELEKEQTHKNYTSEFLTRYEALQSKLLGFLRQISIDMKHPNESSFQDEIHAALSVSEENIPLEGNLPADESPLNEPVSEGDIGLNQPTDTQTRQNNRPEACRIEHSEAVDSQESPFDTSGTDTAPPHQETDSIKDQDDRPEPLNERQLGVQADSYLGMVIYLIDMGGGFLVKMKKHPEFCEFEEIVEMIDQMNEQNMKHIQLSEEEKNMLWPLIIEVLRSSTKQMSTQGHLLMSGAVILLTKIRVAMSIHSEMKVQTQNILEAIREKSPSKPSETEVPKNQDTSDHPSTEPFKEENQQAHHSTNASSAVENNQTPEVSDDSKPESRQADTGSSMDDEAMAEAINEVMQEAAIRNSDQNELVSQGIAEATSNESSHFSEPEIAKMTDVEHGSETAIKQVKEKKHPESMNDKPEAHETPAKEDLTEEINQNTTELTETNYTWFTQCPFFRCWSWW